MGLLEVDPQTVVEVKEAAATSDELTAVAKPVAHTRKAVGAAYTKACALVAGPLQTSATELEAGQEYFLVSLSWIGKLEAQLEAFQSRDGTELSKAADLDAPWEPKVDFLLPVNNSDLVKQSQSWGVLLREGMREDEHFRLVDKRTWAELTDLFGGGPEVSREACKDKSGRVSVDVSGITLLFVTSRNLTEYRIGNFSRSAAVGAVVAEMATRLGLNAADLRMWDFYGGKLHAQLSSPLALEDTNLSHNQLVLLEQRQADGSWELEDREADPARGGPEYRRDSVARSVGLDTASVVSTADGSAAPGLLGLYNLRNTCYMNSTLQCLSNVPQLREFFVSGKFEADINEDNPLGAGGKLAFAFGQLMREMWRAGAGRALSPHAFKAALDDFKSDFAGYMQHDSQELLGYLLDGLHEDINRVKKKRMTDPVEPKGRPDAEVAKEAMDKYKVRNDSLVADLFTGMLLSKVTCPRASCDNVSVTFDPYMMLALPVENGPAKAQEIRCIVIPADAPLLRRQVSVTVPANGSILLLRNAVARAAGLPLASFFLAELSQRKIIRIINDSSSIDSISMDTQVYAIENADAPAHLEMLHGDFTPWFRESLALTGNKLIVDENYLDYRSTDHGEPQDDPADPNAGLEFIRVIEDKESERTIISLVTDAQPGPDQVAAALPASGLSKNAGCPFEQGQVWIGSYGRKQSMRTPVRIEVAAVVPAGEVFQVYMMLDIHKQIPGARDKAEQDARMLVGEYTPATVEARSGGRSRDPRSRGGATSPGSGSSSSPTAVAPSGTANAQRKSASRFSPKNMKKALWGSISGRRKGSASSPPPSTHGSDLSANRSAPTVSAEPQDDAGPDESVPGPDELRPSEGPSNPDVAGKVELSASKWRAMYNNFDETSFVKRCQGFVCTGVVDAGCKVFHGKMVWGGGFQGMGNLDFFVRLVSDKQRDLISSPELANMNFLDRKLALNPTRAVRFVNKLEELGGPAAPERRLSRAGTEIPEQEFELDPGVLLVDKDATEGDLFDALVKYFAMVYNTAIGSLDPAKRAEYDLPDRLDPAQIPRELEIRRAGKNYVLDERRDHAITGKLVEKQSREPFFFSKHSFLRVVVTWSPESPVVRLYDLLALREESARSAASALKIYDCLDLLCGEEKLSEMDSWYCNKCKKHQEAVKTLQIWSLPSVLVLNFKRFSQESEHYTNKVEHLVDFPIEGLDLRRYALDPASREAAMYDLCAVSCHYGGLGSGHYTAFARNEEDGKWYEFDDETVTLVEPVSRICSREAYVLFYLRRDLRPTSWGKPASPASVAKR